VNRVPATRRVIQRCSPGKKNCEHSQVQNIALCQKARVWPPSVMVGRQGKYVAALILLLGWFTLLQYRLGEHVHAPRADEGIREGSDVKRRVQMSTPTPFPVQSRLHTAPPSLSSTPPCPPYCHVMPRTELPGDVVRWGADHLQATAAACCAACSALAGCNTWVWCGNGSACGSKHQQCWLKRRGDPYEDNDILAGRSTMWTSGALGDQPASPAGAGGSGGGGCDLALLTIEGIIRMRVRKQAPDAVRYVAAIVDEVRGQQKRYGAEETSPKTPRVDPSRPVRDGLRFYRAEPVRLHTRHFVERPSLVPTATALTPSQFAALCTGPAALGQPRVAGHLGRRPMGPTLLAPARIVAASGHSNQAGCC
jgi:hypothetical protein